METEERSKEQANPDSPEYEPRIDDVKANLYATVQYWEMRIAAFYFATQGLGRYDAENHYRNAHATVHQEIYENLINAYRNLFMMANFMGPKDRKKIRKMAYDRFLDEGKGIMHLLDNHGESPGRFWSEVEKRLRHLIRSRI
jgi:hypothetical protein